MLQVALHMSTSLQRVRSSQHTMRPSPRVVQHEMVIEQNLLVVEMSVT